MEDYARRLALQLRRGDSLALKGEVGAGKTVFARALIQAIALEATEVTSPTFQLMLPYEVVLPQGGLSTLWHLDLYRIEEEKELDHLGLEEIWPHIVLIEWPEIARAFLPPHTLHIEIQSASQPDRRTLRCESADERWCGKVESIHFQ